MGALSFTNGSNQHSSCFGALLHQDDLPVLHPDGQNVAVVADVEEELPRALLHLPGQVGQHVDAVDVDLVGLVADLVAFEELGRDVRCRRRPRGVSAASPDG